MTKEEIEKEINILEKQIEDLKVSINMGEDITKYHPFKKYLENRLFELIVLVDPTREAERGLDESR